MNQPQRPQQSGQDSLRREKQLSIACIVFSAFCFALMNLFIRLTGDVPTLQKCFFRNLFALMIALAALKKSKTPLKWEKGNLKYLLARSVSGGLGMVCNFWAVDRLAISDASMLNKLSPFFAIIFSYFLLKERVTVPEWVSVCTAFFGAMLIVKPTFGFEAVPALAGLAGGFGAGIAYACVRALSKRGENGTRIVAFFSGFTTLCLLPFLLFQFQPMTARQWVFSVLTGLAASGGQIFITKAYSKAPAKEISVYDFSIVIFAAILGYFVLGQVPDLLSSLGCAVIIGTAIVQHRRTMRSIAAQPQETVEST